MIENIRARWLELSHEHRGNLVEWVTEQAIRNYCRAGDTAIDIGANYGAHTHTMLVQVGPTGRVIAFEANPDITPHLLTWVARHPSLEVRQVALSDHAGRAQFYVCDNAGFSSLNQGEIERHGQIAKKVIDVNLDTLDDCLMASLTSVRLIKIDVEGAELPVLRGAKQVMDTFKPVVIVEMSAAELRRLEPKAYSIFESRTLGDGYTLVSVLGEVVSDPAPGDYQFFLVPTQDPTVIDEICVIARNASAQFFEEKRQGWTPYQKFQTS